MGDKDIGCGKFPVGYEFTRIRGPAWLRSSGHANENSVLSGL